MSLASSPRRRRPRPLLALLLLFAPACGLVLDLPDPQLGDLTTGDPGGDGSTQDGSTDDGGGSTDGDADGAPGETGSDSAGTDGTTTCDLTLPANCGACGVDCTNGLCDQGICTLTTRRSDSSALKAASGITLYQGNAYFTTGTAIVKCATNGCLAAGAGIISSPFPTSVSPRAIIVDSTGTLFWTSYTNGYQTDGVYRHPVSGTQVHINAGFPSPGAEAVTLSTDESTVFWTSYGTGGGGLACPRAGCPGGGPLKVAGVPAEGPVAVLNTPHGVAWGSLPGGTVELCAQPDCANSTNVSTGEGGGVGTFALHGTSVLYWRAAAPTPTIRRAVLPPTGTVETVYPKGGSSLGALPSEMLIVGDTLYWTLSGTAPSDGGNTTDGAVQKCVLPACTTAITVASNQAAPAGLAADGKAIYWVNVGRASYIDGTGSVMKAPL